MPSPDRANGSPVRRPSSFVRDLGVTVVVFLALVGAVARWLWIRVANDRGGDLGTDAGPQHVRRAHTGGPLTLGPGGRGVRAGHRA